MGVRSFGQRGQTIEVETGEVTVSDISEGFSASGEVNSSEFATLTFSTSGQVSWVGAKEGDTVTKWQGLASLNTKTLALQLEKLLNLFEREFTEFDDTNYSVRDDILTDSVRRIKERAQIDLDQTVIDVEIQKEALRLSGIVAPFRGVITKTYFIFPGMNVTPATPVFDIANPDRVYFEAEINETDVPTLSNGGNAKIALDSYPDEIYEGTIESIGFASFVSTTGGTAYKVKITLPDNENMKFRLGMGGDAQFILFTRENVLVIPATALVEEDGKSYVWTVENGRAKKVEVETGAISLDTVEIVSGVNEEQKVIIRPPVRIKEGMKIKAKINK